jgi:glycosyltransferase involved in cell wall biosynthesis
MSFAETAIAAHDTSRAAPERSTPLHVSIVIPAFNEARRLPATLAGWNSYLAEQAFTSQLLIVDDGSRDDTAAVAEDGGAEVLRLVPNQGKGGAVRAGMLAAGGERIAYADADMNVAPNHLGRALQLIEQGADLVAGQRELSEYASAEGPIRLAAGGLVQVTRRVLVVRSVRDTQCGFKVFRKPLAQAVFSRTLIRSFAFDIEVLYLAKMLRARIATMPVTTTFHAESTFNVRKHLPQFLHDIVQIRLNAMQGRYDLGGTH